MRNWNSPTVYSWQQNTKKCKQPTLVWASHSCPGVVGEVRPPPPSHLLPLTEQQQLDLPGCLLPVVPQIPVDHLAALHRRLVLRAQRAPHPRLCPSTPRWYLKKKNNKNIYNSIKMKWLNAASAFTPRAHTHTHTHTHTHALFFFKWQAIDLFGERGGEKGGKRFFCFV